MSECADFLRLLFGPEWPGRKVNVWKKKRLTKAGQSGGGTSHWIDKPDDGDRFSGETDVYVQTGMMPRGYGAKHRGEIADVVGIPGTWIDVDVTGSPTDTGKPKKDAAADEDVALELIRAVAPPTAIVRSGYGVQGWWLFPEPWIWDAEDTESRERARSVVWGLWRRAADLAQEAGFQLDATHDLLRLMRLPGTQNGKAGLSAPVNWLDPDDEGPRYPVDALEALAPQGRPQAAAVVGADVTISPNGSPDPDRLAMAISASPEFADCWSRVGSPPPDSSPSGWCMRLANMVARWGWPQQEMANLLVAYRRKHGDGEKHPGFYEQTIAKAREGQTREQRDREVTEQINGAVEVLKDVAEDPAPPDAATEDKVLDAFNRLAPGLQVKEIIKQGQDPGSVRYALVRADGARVEVGTGKQLLDPDHVASAIMDGTPQSIVMLPVKRADWRLALRGLMRAARHVASESDDSVTLGLVANYLAQRLVSGEEEWSDAAFRREPYEREGFVHLSMTALLRYLRRIEGETIKRADLTRRLTNVGFEPEDVSCAPAGQVDRNRRTKRTVWRVERERLP